MVQLFKSWKNQLGLPVLVQLMVPLKVQLSPSGQDTGSQYMVAAEVQLQR